MLKRLIEVALPLKEVSEQSAREKSIRHGHISTLHIWWARRPLAACRAVVFASLIPDPDDPECPESFRKAVRKELGEGQFKPTGINGETIEDTARNRCMEFIKELVKWENSNNPHYIEPARRLIRAGHAIFHPESANEAPKVLDPFAGGGAIPLEALRLGCEAHAVDINPVAHLIELCTLVYPQKYGRPLPPSAPVPDYILESAKKPQNGTGHLFGRSTREAEAVYRKNPLAADVKYWGTWVLARLAQEMNPFFDPKSIAHIWCRTVECPNPSCRAHIPLIEQLGLRTDSKRCISLKFTQMEKRTRSTDFEIVEGNAIDFDPTDGTIARNTIVCPQCHTAQSKKWLASQAKNARYAEQLLVIVERAEKGKTYRVARPDDVHRFASASERLAEIRADVPSEELPYLRSIFNCHVYGIKQWSALFNDRQLLTLVVAARLVREASENITRVTSDQEYAKAVQSYLAFALDRMADRNSSLCRWIPQTEAIGYTFARQALGMVWDYVEVHPTNYDAAWRGSVAGICEVIENLSAFLANPGSCYRASAAGLPIPARSLHCIVTDPPYYDAVPYADLSDFFYVWLKRSLGGIYPDLFKTPLTPKAAEMVQLAGRNPRYSAKTKEFFEASIRSALVECRRVMLPSGVVLIMYAHKATAAWEALVQAILSAGLYSTASWPLHTERTGRLRAYQSAALGSSVTIACRTRDEGAVDGVWDDVQRELRAVAGERLDFFWSHGIRGADFFISAIGPALSVFGRYRRVTRLTGEDVTAGQFLDEVRAVVTHYALSKIMKNVRAGAVDPETQFYVMWRWSYADVPVPADEAFKLAQALGLETDAMWDSTGILTKSGENVQATPIAERMKIKDMGDPAGDGRPASVVDVLHRLCALRAKGDSVGMGEFLSRSGQTNNQSLWTVAQAMSEILPDGDKEKQLLQGLLNQRDGLMEAARQGTLFREQ